MPCTLTYRDPDRRERTFEIPEDLLVRIGSSPDCEIVLDFPDVLPIHAALKRQGEKVLAASAHRESPIEVNRQAADRRLLVHGDVLTIGGQELRFEIVRGDPLVGHQLAGYLIEQLIGVGGSGMVYRAKQLSLDRTVALKVLSPELAGDAALAEKFTGEARAMAKLNHPKVVQIHDAVRDGVHLFLVLEFLPGGTVAQLLKDQGRLDATAVLAIARDVAEALAWATEMGLVHRDIKPSNLLLTREGTVKVADLGLAIGVADSEGGRRWGGSPRYMAPEQGMGLPVDCRADIYSLGCTLFHALTGKPPFTASTAREIIALKAKAEPPRVSDIDAGIPWRLAELVDVMIAREPENRFGSWLEVLAALGTVEKEMAAPDAGAPAPHASPVTVGAALPRQKAGRSWKIYVGSMAAVALGLTLLSIFWPVKPGDEVAVPQNGGAETEKAVPVEPQETDVAPQVDRDPLLADADAVMDDLRKGAIDAESASVRLRRMTSQSNDPSFRAELERRLARVLAEVERTRGTVALARLMKDVEGMIAGGDFRLAEKRLSEAPPETKAKAEASLRERIRESAAKAWSEVRASAAKAVDAGKFDEAEALLAKAAAKLPRSFDKESEAEAAGLDRQRAAHAKFCEEMDRLEGEIDVLIGKLDFQGALALAAKPPAAPPSAAKRVDSFRKSGEDRASRCRAAWEKILAGAEAAAAGGRPVRLASDAIAVRGKEEYRIAGVDRATKTMRLAEPSVERHVLSLATPLLLEFAGTAGPGSGDGKEAVGLLLLDAGPFRARPLLLPSAEAATAARREKILQAAEDGLVARTTEGFDRRTADLAGADAAPALWKALVEDIAISAKGIEGSPRAKGFEPRFEAAYVKARAASLRKGGASEFFHGRIKRFDGKSIALVYDFSSPEQIADLVPVLRSGCLVDRVKGGARIFGEFRFLRGDPFRRKLVVTVDVTPEGFNPGSPNINLAFWTREGGRVTPIGSTEKPDREKEDDGKREAESSGDEDQENSSPPDVESEGERNASIDASSPPAGDYVVFGLGFSPVPILAGAEIPRISVAGEGRPVDLPAQVLILGNGGRPLSFPEQKCLYASSVRGKLKGAQSSAVAFDAGEISWTVSHRVSPLKKSIKNLRPGGNWIGSFSILTNGDVVLYSSLEVQGELNPGWIEAQLESRARIEWAELRKKG
jgi:hypothetical protein